MTTSKEKTVSMWDDVAADTEAMKDDLEGLAAELVTFGSRSTVLAARATRVTVEGTNYLLKLTIDIMPEHGDVGAAIDTLFVSK